MNTQRTSFSIKSGTDSSSRPIPAEQLAAAKARGRTQGSDSLKKETRSFKELRESYKSAIKSIKSIKDNKLNTFLTFDEGAVFLSELMQAHDGKLYHDDFDRALSDRFGVDVDWDQLEM